MFKILDGIRIVDLTAVVLGPFSTQMLGDFGAEIVKVENLGGDTMRWVRPGKSDGMGAGFINCNRNKEAIAVNLKTPQGKDIIYRLVQSADVFVHNMRSKTAANLGVGYDALKKLNPSLIYCSAQGFGEQGPSADIPAYDDIIQAASGLAYLNADDLGNPRYVPTVVADKVAGLQLTAAVLGGIINKLKTGEGMFIESPMFEGMVSFLMAEQMGGLSYRPAAGTMGYDRLTAPFRRPYPTADGFMAILPYSTANWIDFFNAVGREELAKSDLVTNPRKRSDNINTLYEKLNEIAPEKTTDEWCDLLRDMNIPHTRVNRMQDLFEDEHLVDVGLFEDYEHPTEGSMVRVRSHYNMQGVEESADAPAQQLGQSTRSVLAELGFEEDDISALIEQGVVA